MPEPKKAKCLQCDECGGFYGTEKRDVNGFGYDVLVCPKCGDVVFTMDQAQHYREAHSLAQMAQKRLAPLTLRQVGNSVNATVPKEFASIGFKKGEKFRWEVQGPGVLALHLLQAGSEHHAPIPRQPRKVGSTPREGPARRRKTTTHRSAAHGTQR